VDEKGSRVLVLEGQGCRFEFDRAAGTFSILTGGRYIFKDAVGRVLLSKRGGPVSLTTSGTWDTVAHTGKEVALVKREDWGRLLFRARARGKALTVELGLTWEEAGEPPGIEAVIPLDVPPGGTWPGRESNRSWRFYQNGWQCWTATGTLKRRRPGDYLFVLFTPKRLKPMLANTATPVSSEKGRFTGEWFGGLADLDTDESVVVGFTGVSRALSQVSVRIGGKPSGCELEAAARFEGKPPVSGIEFWGEPLAIIPGDLSGRNLEEYAELVAEEQGVGELRRSPAGWCSWYQYFRNVTSEGVEKNLELLSDRYRGLDIELVQVDDGYQKELGDWLETSPGFAGGMKRLADEIASRGKMPGIWVAPFTVMRRSRLFKEKKDWVLRSKKGRPVLAGVNPMWKWRFYGLDLTHPEVLDWLREVFTTLKGYGYHFFKLDFLACGLLEGKRYDPSVTRAEAARRALAVIREAVGEDSIIMTAGCPILLGTGIFDIQRIGPDVAPYWRAFYQPLIRDRSTPSTRNCLINTFTRCFMHGRLWEADPDCLLVRGSEISLDEAERRTLASGVAMLGGAFMISDDLSLWGPEEEELAGCLLPPLRTRPFCPDLWRREVPRYMVNRLEDPGGAYFLVWAVNWSGSRRSMKMRLSELGVGPGRYHVSEFWTGIYLGVTADDIKVDGVPGHGSAVLRLTPVSDEPRLVGSNIHISQGAAELGSLDRASDGVALALKSRVKRKAVITLAIPGAESVIARDDKGPLSTEHLGQSVHRVQFELDGLKEIRLSWQENDSGGVRE